MWHSKQILLPTYLALIFAKGSGIDSCWVEAQTAAKSAAVRTVNNLNHFIAIFPLPLSVDPISSGLAGNFVGKIMRQNFRPPSRA